MPKYIDREALLAEFEWLKSVEDPYQRDRTEDAIQRIKNAPVADVVPVVRCKNCKRYLIADEFDGGKRKVCEVNHFSYLNSDGDMHFCSYGKPKEGQKAFC